MSKKLEAILQKRGVKLTPTLAELQSEIQESVRAELIDRRFSDYAGAYEQVTVKLGHEDKSGGSKKYTMTVRYSALSNRDDDDSKIFTEFTDQLGAIKTCGTFRAEKPIPNFNSKIIFTAHSLGDLLDALNRVISNPDLRIDSNRFGQAR